MPSRARVSPRSRGKNTVVSAPFGTTSTGRTGVPACSVASRMARLTVAIWSMDSTAWRTCAANRGLRATRSMTSARWAVASTGTPSSRPTRAAAQPSGTSI